jgi:hypothetical protein
MFMFWVFLQFIEMKVQNLVIHELPDPPNPNTFSCLKEDKERKK